MDDHVTSVEVYTMNQIWCFVTGAKLPITLNVHKPLVGPSCMLGHGFAPIVKELFPCMNLKTFAMIFI